MAKGLHLPGKIADPTPQFHRCLEVANSIAAHTNWWCFAIASFTASPLLPAAEQRLLKDTADVAETARLVIPAAEDLVKYAQAFAQAQG